MIKQKYIFVLLLSILSSTVFSQDLNGKWDASMPGPQGAMTMVFDFIVDGDALRGSMSSDMMGTTEISDGVINGDEFSFYAPIPVGPDGLMQLRFKGRIENDALDMSMQPPAMPGLIGIPAVDAPPSGGMPIIAVRARGSESEGN